VKVATEADQAVADCFASRWVSCEIREVPEVRLRQEVRGRPGRDTRYRRITTTRHQLHFVVREELVATDACSDGCWPLATNDGELPAVYLLVAYTHQPDLERRPHPSTTQSRTRGDAGMPASSAIRWMSSVCSGVKRTQ
jgi:hypothetical protein